MFVGREKELKALNKLYDNNDFQFAVIYGRRRIGKTELLKEFAKDKNIIFYSAIEKKTNIEEFSSVVLSHFNENSNLIFRKWQDIFEYISNHTNNDRIALIIDEFPYIAKNEPEVKSIMQHMIDHKWINQNIMLVLCGSSVSFMINDVMGSKSPLYGRNTMVLEVLPFDYTEVKKFLPNYSKEEQMMVYGVLGGVPYYLSKFSKNKSVEENIANLIIEPSSILREEPITLLKAELREPMTYNSILQVIANGTNRLSEIADKAKIDATKLPVYIKSLMEMKLVDKKICCGEKENSKKSQYVISDNFFSFWYRFVFSKNTMIELMNPLEYVDSIKELFYTYMGSKFEIICLQYLKNLAKLKKLPFIPSSLGKWWGTNKITKQQDDIDILGIDEDKYLFCECKFTNEKFDKKELDDLIISSNHFENAKEKYYYIFSKSGFTSSVIKEATAYNMKLISIEEM